ncbi:MAG: toprim domain-containing protein, partial [Clostridia bacterium]|nr:toprim domain-containing protein [Clostridia bacterium]
MKTCVRESASHPRTLPGADPFFEIADPCVDARDLHHRAREDAHGAGGVGGGELFVGICADPLDVEADLRLGGDAEGTAPAAAEFPVRGVGGHAESVGAQDLGVIAEREAGGGPGTAAVILPDEEFHGDEAGARERAGEKERLVRLNEAASEFFCRWLKETPDSEAGRYLARRGIPADVAAKFRIGAAPDGWDNLLRHLRSKGFKDDEGVTAGVLHRSEAGRVFDQFRNRLVFSIFNETNRGVGFSARSLEAKPQDGRKYINTPETPVFRKGMLLYALPLAREAMVKRKLAILCEGQLDTIAFHRAGFECAVAPLGTAFTPEQARVLKRYTNHIALAFDSDGAGQKAVLRAAEILLPLSVEIKVIRIPGGKDPDELFASGGAEAVAAAVDSAVSWLTVVIDALADQFDLGTPVGKGEAAAFVVNYLILVGNRVELETYVRDTAAALKVREEAIYAELAAERRRERRKEDFRQPEPPRKPVAQRRTYSPAVLTLLELAI